MRGSRPSPNFICVHRRASVVPIIPATPHPRHDEVGIADESEKSRNSVLLTFQICASCDDLLHGERRRTTRSNDLDIVRSARILIRTEEGRRTTVTTEEASCCLRSHCWIDGLRRCLMEPPERRSSSSVVTVVLRPSSVRIKTKS